MREIERVREREEQRQQPSGDAAGSTTGGGTNFFNVVDQPINNTVSADSEAFNQQIEQENGQ